MAYFALPPQSVPIRIVNPAAAAAAAAARVAEPDGPTFTHHNQRDPDGRDTPKAVIGSVLPLPPSTP